MEVLSGHLLIIHIKITNKFRFQIQLLLENGMLCDLCISRMNKQITKPSIPQNSKQIFHSPKLELQIYVLKQTFITVDIVW